MRFLEILAVIAVLVISISATAERNGGGPNLGKLHWCNTLCLCHDETREAMHCFTDMQIYSLLNLDARKAQRLSLENFRLGEKLTWCNETCLCHKTGRKVFKCTEMPSLTDFIRHETPSLAQYLEDGISDKDETFEKSLDETSDKSLDETFEEGNASMKEDNKEKHERRKANRKHRKNKKKPHDEEVEEIEEIANEEASPSSGSPEEPKSSYQDASLNTNNEDKSSNSDMAMEWDIPSSSPTRDSQIQEPPLQEIPPVFVHREKVEDLQELTLTVDEIKDEVATNQRILLGAIIVASFAIAGVLLISVYICCLRRSRKKHVTGRSQCNHHSLHQEDNNVTKPSLEEAW